MIQFVLSPPDALGGPVSSFVSDALATGAEPIGRAVKFTHEGESWWGELARSQLRTSDDIWVGSIVPEAELLAGLPNTSLIVIVTTVVVLLLAVLRATWLARRYATPLEELTDHGNRMQRLNFEPVEPVESEITEIRHLSATLERMCAALQTFSAAREDVRVARSIREMTLPREPVSTPRLELRAWHQPADEVGGECYDVVQRSTPAEDSSSPSRVVVAFFDFPGTGVAAAVHGSQLRAAFRSGTRAGLDLGALAARLEAFLRMPGRRPPVFPAMKRNLLAPWTGRSLHPPALRCRAS